jgi:hypothetical protein
MYCYHHVPLQQRYYYYCGESLNLSVFHHPSVLALPSFVGFPQHTIPPSPPSSRVELPLVVSVVDGEEGSKEENRKEEKMKEEEEDYDSFSW